MSTAPPLPSWTSETKKDQVIDLCIQLIDQFFQMTQTERTKRIHGKELIDCITHWWARHDFDCHGVAFEEAPQERLSLADTLWYLLSFVFHVDHTKSKIMLEANTEIQKHTPPLTYTNGNHDHFIATILRRELKYRIATYHWIIPTQIFFSTDTPLYDAAEAKRKAANSMSSSSSSSSSASNNKKNEKLAEERKQRDTEEMILKSSTFYPILQQAESSQLLAYCSAFIISTANAPLTPLRHEVLTLASRLYGTMNLERHLLQEYPTKVTELPSAVIAARDKFHLRLIDDLKYELGSEFYTQHYNALYSLLNPALATRRYTRLRRENHANDKLFTKFLNTYNELCYSVDHSDALLRESSEWVYKEPQELIKDRESILYDLFASSMFIRLVKNLSPIKNAEDYFVYPDEVMNPDKLKRLTSFLMFTIPHTPYRPIIFVFGKNIYVRDYKTLYVCERLLDAWLCWLFLIHSNYNNQMEKWDVSVTRLSELLFPVQVPPPPPLPVSASPK
jgi:hypothetical protein